MTNTSENFSLTGATVAVTGACGFIGSHLVEKLLLRGVSKIIAIDSLEFGHKDNLPADDKVVFIKHDLGTDDISEIKNAMAGVTFLFHLAAQKYNQSKASPDSIYFTNIIGTDHLYRMAVESGVKKIVFSSSLYAYGRASLPSMIETEYPTPSTIYGISKLAGEYLLQHFNRQYGISTVALRFFFAYGTKQYPGLGYKSVIVKNFERILQQLPPVIYGDGQQALDYVYVEDMVEGILRAAELKKAEGEVINLGSGQPTSIIALTDLMLKTANSSLKPVFEKADQTHGTIRVSDPSKASKLLGWQTTTPLSVGLLRTYEWLKART